MSKFLWHFEFSLTRFYCMEIVIKQNGAMQRTRRERKTTNNFIVMSCFYLRREKIRNENRKFTTKWPGDYRHSDDDLFVGHQCQVRLWPVDRLKYRIAWAQFDYRTGDPRGKCLDPAKVLLTRVDTTPIFFHPLFSRKTNRNGCLNQFHCGSASMPNQNSYSNSSSSAPFCQCFKANHNFIRNSIFESKSESTRENPQENSVEDKQAARARCILFANYSNVNR